MWMIKDLFLFFVFRWLKFWAAPLCSESNLVPSAQARSARRIHPRIRTRSYDSSLWCCHNLRTQQSDEKQEDEGPDTREGFTKLQLLLSLTSYSVTFGPDVPEDTEKSS